MKIMIVENNELMRKEIMQAVVKKDDIIMVCAEAESALQHCVEFDPDWLFLAIRMEKMDGLTAAKQIRELKPDSKIAFITSNDLEVYRKAAEDLGIKYYFLKNNLSKIRNIIQNT